MIIIPPLRKIELLDLQEFLKISFNDLVLLNHALTHSSYVNENKLKKGESNERLEFLGDAVLELITNDYLYNRYPDYDEGNLTKVKSALVSKPVLAKESLRLELGKYILLGKGEENTGGRDRDSILSNVFEALLGAYYLDSGLESARNFVVDNFLQNIEEKGKKAEDYKSRFQELMQAKYRKRPVYVVSGHSGPEHNKMFVVKACFKGKVLGRGEGPSKKEAQQMAAKEAMEKIINE